MAYTGSIAGAGMLYGFSGAARGSGEGTEGAMACYETGGRA